MDDLISRQSAIAVADSSDYVGLSVEDVKKVTDEVVKGLKRLPSAQPEIVRCKDCKHKPSGDGVNHRITFPDERCPCQCDDSWYSWLPDDDWFCGNAERREE